MSQLRVLVCGGRDYANDRLVMEIMNYVRDHARFHGAHDLVVIEGGASGADRLVRTWAVAQGFPVWTYRADWHKYGRAAGPLRNKRMLDEGAPHGVIAFPGGRGTQNMIDLARKAGIAVWEVS